MKVQIAKELYELYNTNHRNMEYSLETLLNSLDPESCEKALNMVTKIDIGGNKIDIDISENSVGSIKDVIKNNIENDMIELLLWIAILYPEI